MGCNLLDDELLDDDEPLEELDDRDEELLEDERDELLDDELEERLDDELEDELDELDEEELLDDEELLDADELLDAEELDGVVEALELARLLDEPVGLTGLPPQAASRLPAANDAPPDSSSRNARRSASTPSSDVGATFRFWLLTTLPPLRPGRSTVRRADRRRSKAQCDG